MDNVIYVIIVVNCVPIMTRNLKVIDTISVLLIYISHISPICSCYWLNV